MQETRRGYLIDITPEMETSHATRPSKKRSLRIDNKIVPYLSTPEGYRIYYCPPTPSLYEAACNYVDLQREKAK